ncbi:Transmembrane protein [Hirschfeldia incana]|nr:Transmembrane protein [Hirschfeldia incana]
MAYQANFDTMPPSSVAPRPWWSRPMMTVPPSSERDYTCKEVAVMCIPSCGGFFTLVLVFLIFSFIDDAHSHAKISLQSFAVSSDTWQSDFIVKIPSSRYSIYYDGDDAAVSLGSQNVAVLNITSHRVSKDHTALSLFFVAEEGSRSDVVSEDLDIKLRAKHKRYEDYDKAVEFNIRCQNLTRGREKIICESSFTDLKLFSLIRRRGTIEY